MFEDAVVFPVVKIEPTDAWWSIAPLLNFPEPFSFAIAFSLFDLTNPELSAELGSRNGFVEPGVLWLQPRADSGHVEA